MARSRLSARSLTQSIRRPAVAVPLAALAVIGGLVVLLGPIAYWSTASLSELTGKERADTITATRQVLLAAAAGSAALAGLAFTARNYYLSRRGQLTDRFGRAITQLAADKLTERLGGIYALEHLMAESGHDHDTVVEVLAAFVRERTNPGGARVPGERVHAHEEHGSVFRTLPTDVQAALTVLGRRPHRGERHAVNLARTELCGADIASLRLNGANLWHTRLHEVVAHGVHLENANLCWAQLRDSRFGRANLRGAALSGAELQEVTFDRAVLRNTDLRQADLRDARLVDADLRDARLGDANLHGADLTGADLRGADLVTGWRGATAPVRGVSVQQLLLANLDESTRLPAALVGEAIRRQRRRLHQALVAHRQATAPTAPAPPAPAR